MGGGPVDRLLCTFHNSASQRELEKLRDRYPQIEVTLHQAKGKESVPKGTTPLYTQQADIAHLALTFVI
jgi:quinolinate synthase